jgi:hypothetical protein
MLLSLTGVLLWDRKGKALAGPLFHISGAGGLVNRISAIQNSQEKA